MLGFSVNPEGSKRVLVSLSTRAFSGAPYCSPIEIERASPSLKPESVEPS